MKRVKSVWILIILAILLGCASSPFRKGYISGEGKTIEVDKIEDFKKITLHYQRRLVIPGRSAHTVKSKP